MNLAHAPRQQDRPFGVADGLFLGSADADALFLDSGGSPSDLTGPADGALLLSSWRWSNNWREIKPPKGSDLLAKAWIPVAPKDTLLDQIDVQSRKPHDASFLRPAKDSPLATAGAGGDLPAYVGAVPPEGGEAWDWGKTWKARQKVGE